MRNKLWSPFNVHSLKELLESGKIKQIDETIAQNRKLENFIVNRMKELAFLNQSKIKAFKELRRTKAKFNEMKSTFLLLNYR